MNKTRGRRLVAACGVVVLVASLTACGVWTSEQTLMKRAAEARSQGDTAAAVENLKEVLRKNSANVPARLALAQINLQAGDINAAIIELKSARRDGANPDLIAELLARAYLLGHQPEDAIKAIGEARDPSSPSLMAVKGAALVQLRRLPEARQTFESALERDPRNLNALLGLGAVVAELEGVDAALAVSERAVQVAPESAQVHLLRGRLLLRAKSFEPAREQLEAALAAADKNAAAQDRLAALSALADLHFTQRQVEESLAVTQRMQQLGAENPATRFARARALMLAGKPAEARPLLEKNVAADPEAIESKFLLGLLALQTGLYGQAEMYLASVVGVAPDNQQARVALEDARRRGEKQRSFADARDAQQLGDKNAQIRAYESILERDPNDAFALNNLAWLKYEAGKGDALPLAKRAHELAPRDPRIIDTYAWLLVESGQVREGLALLKPIAGEGADAEVRKHYAQALARAGKLE